MGDEQQIGRVQQITGDGITGASSQKENCWRIPLPDERERMMEKCSNSRCTNKVKKLGWFCNDCRKRNLHLTEAERIKLQLDELERKNGKK